MGVISAVQSAFQKLARAWSQPLSQTPNVLFGGYTSTAGQDVTPDTALSLSAVFAAVNLLSRTVSTLPLNVYRRYGRDKEAAVTHPAYRLLHGQPNPEMTAATFRRTLEWHRLLYGNCYAEISWAGNGKPVALWPIEPWRVKPMRDDQGNLYYQIDNADNRLPPEDILHVPLLSNDGVCGRGWISYATESLGLGMASQEFAAAYFGNGAKPGMILRHPGTPTPEARKQMRSTWDDRHQGSARSHGTAVLWGGWELSNDSTFTPEQSQLIEQRRFTTEEVSRWLGIPPHLLRDLNRATYCLPAGEPVYTEEGPKPIDQIKVGDRVWSRDDLGKLVLSNVVKSSPTGFDRVLTIKTTNRTLRCNAKHPVLCRVKKLKLKSTQGIGGANTPEGVCSVEWETKYVKAGDLKIGDTIVTLDYLPDGGSLEVCPTRIPTIGFMEFCGLLIGDGNIICNMAAGSAYITIARGKNASYMDYYREVIQNEFTKNNGEPVVLQEGDRQTRFCSLKAVQELKTLGFSGNARTKRVPGWIFKLPKIYRLAFIRGFLDADGTCDKLGRLSFSSCSRELLEQIRHLCMGCGVPVTNLRVQEGETILPNKERKSFRQFGFTCSDPGQNKLISSRTPHYIARLESGRPFSRKSRNYPRFGGEGFNESGLSLARVCDIAIGNSEIVYDLTVEGTHSFVANGVIVHNSNIEQQGTDFLVYSLNPILIDYEQEFDRKLLWPPEVYCKHNVTALLRGDSAARSAFYREMFNIGVLSINEIRELEDRNPILGGDEHFVPLNLGTLTSLATPPAPVESAIPDVPVEPTPAPQPAPALPAPTPPPEAPSPALATDPVKVGVVLSTLTRLQRVELNAILRQANKPQGFLAWVDQYYAKHTLRLAEALGPVFAVAGVDWTPTEAADTWCIGSRKKLFAVTDTTTAKTFPEAILKLEEDWKDRPKEFLARLEKQLCQPS